MLDYVSDEGAEELAGLRVGSRPKATSNRAPIRLLARVPSDECGCPEELWHIDGLIVLMHMEEHDGTGEVFIFAGDWEAEKQFKCDDINALRANMFGWIAELEIEEIP